jgi:hypothetical protein
MPRESLHENTSTRLTYPQIPGITHSEFFTPVPDGFDASENKKVSIENQTGDGRDFMERTLVKDLSKMEIEWYITYGDGHYVYKRPHDRFGCPVPCDPLHTCQHACFDTKSGSEYVEIHCNPRIPLHKDTVKPLHGPRSGLPGISKTEFFTPVDSMGAPVETNSVSSAGKDISIVNDELDENGLPKNRFACPVACHDLHTCQYFCMEPTWNRDKRVPLHPRTEKRLEYPELKGLENTAKNQETFFSPLNTNDHFCYRSPPGLTAGDTNYHDL